MDKKPVFGRVSGRGFGVRVPGPGIITPGGGPIGGCPPGGGAPIGGCPPGPGGGP